MSTILYAYENIIIKIISSNEATFMDQYCRSQKPLAIDLKTSVSCVRHISSSCWPETPRVPQTKQAIAITFVFTWEFLGKVLFLKTQHTFNTGHRWTELEMSWKLLPYCTDFIVQEGLCTLMEDKMNHQSCPALNPPNYNNALPDPLSSAIVVWLWWG